MDQSAIMMPLVVMMGPLDPLFFFFNDTATTEIYTLSLHDALPIYQIPLRAARVPAHVHQHAHLVGRQPGLHGLHGARADAQRGARADVRRSEEHTSELQSPDHLVCRLLLEKKKNKTRKEQ